MKNYFHLIKYPKSRTRISKVLERAAKQVSKFINPSPSIFVRLTIQMNETTEVLKIQDYLRITFNLISLGKNERP